MFFRPLLIAFSVLSSSDTSGQGWPAYGGDAGGMRYSSLTEINKANVSGITPAWTFRTGELETYNGTEALSKAAFETTPILVNNSLVFSTPSSRIFAINPATGKQIWMYDARVDLKKYYSEITSRGVAAWHGKNKTYIFVGTIDGRLIAIDARDGQPVLSFGDKGSINLRTGYGDDISMTSPPAVISNIIVVGSSLGDNYKYDFPRGIVRAFNAETGKELWTWDPISFDTAHNTGAANAWSIISADEKRGLVFIPTSSPSPDYYGGRRPGKNEYANSIVALNALTGKMVWHFQVVHHDLWDYDIAAQPMLIDVEKDKQKIPAVAVGTKMGHIFILNRETGKPIFPVEERPVSASDIPGETANATQPFPILPAPLGIQNISIEDAWGATAEGKTIAQERISRYINKGPFTPPSTKGTLVTPGNVGGIHWGGMCYDPVNNILFTNINRLAAVIRVIPRDKVADEEKADEGLLRSETGPQHGTPYVLKRDYLFAIENKDFVMQSKPPWGTLNAIDLHDGSQKWEVPLGFMMDTTKYPNAKKWGSLNFGGAIVTGGNLVFVAATRDNYFRAFNSLTGAQLWEYLLPASAQATPMTYSVKGKQYVVIAAGGHGKFLTKQGDYIVAFALPDRKN